ncbi:hypothetical protein A6302_00654 [Methylobrevis pamukkalensis]|uniref:Uncharacterized protein n=2 Tax=Methylobrevis pamukkalensis TaxID=1439726 RepID=A0A1E3H6R6_9HYPH|nr:hypothetical protein A6302_00654 [Methylobrevis pamukkalensis]
MLALAPLPANAQQFGGPGGGPGGGLGGPGGSLGGGPGGFGGFGNDGGIPETRMPGFAPQGVGPLILGPDPIEPARPPSPGEGGAFEFPSRTNPAALPYAPSTDDPLQGLQLESPLKKPELLVSARLTEDGAPIASGVVWRVYGADPGADGKLPLVGSAEGGEHSFELDPGSYLVHCDFGYASTTIHAVVDGGIERESAVLNAGGLRLAARNADEEQISSEKLRFDVYMMDYNEVGERRVVAEDIPAGEIVRLPARRYHIVSRYGEVNATVRADIDVQAGKLTELELEQNAAEVTLKLVNAPGGEAIADTRWSVLTPGGDIVTEGIGAFPTFVLASGGYTVVAKHDQSVYSRDFEVKAGSNGDVEVLTSDLDTSSEMD